MNVLFFRTFVNIISCYVLVSAFFVLCNTSFGVTGDTWTSATLSASWSPRIAHTAETFKGKMWVLGGADDSGALNEVWSSVNGTSWTLEKANAEWSPRFQHGSVVFDGKLWVIGGGTNTNGLEKFNDVWSSTDGVNWTQVTADAPWTPRVDFTQVVHDNKIWIFGGFEDESTPGGAYLNDVWYTEDGENWTSATLSANWSVRDGHSAVSFDGDLYIFGGFNPSVGLLNDVWRSADGSDWVEVTSSADWTPRVIQTSQVFDKKMWVIAGIDATDPQNDAWFSTNGADWTAATSNAQFEGRVLRSASFVIDDRMFIVGGGGGIGGDLAQKFDKLNDVWFTQAELPPEVIVPPAPQTVILGEDASFNIEAIGTPPLDYQWQKNGGDIGGATSFTLTLEDVDLADEGLYRCVVTNGFGVAVSTSASLSVLIPPAIETQPLSQDAAEGTTVTFSVSASGSEPLFYQWQKDGVDLDGESSSTLTLPSVTFDDEGEYRCVVTSEAGIATSDAAALRVFGLREPTGVELRKWQYAD